MTEISVDLESLEAGTPEHLGRAILKEAKKALGRDDIDIRLDGPFFVLFSSAGDRWALRDIPSEGMIMSYRLEPHAPADDSLTENDVFNRSLAIIDSEIRQYLVADGGNIELLSARAFEADGEKHFELQCVLQGACAGCPGAQMTLKNGVEAVLRRKVHPNIIIVQPPVAE
ncbi:MAG: NifU family protein [Planctomycetota bacterium]